MRRPRKRSKAKDKAKDKDKDNKAAPKGADAGSCARASGKGGGLRMLREWEEREEKEKSWKTKERESRIWRWRDKCLRLASEQTAAGGESLQVPGLKLDWGQLQQARRAKQLSANLNLSGPSLCCDVLRSVRQVLVPVLRTGCQVAVTLSGNQGRAPGRSASTATAAQDQVQATCDPSSALPRIPARTEGKAQHEVHALRTKPMRCLYLYLYLCLTGPPPPAHLIRLFTQPPGGLQPRMEQQEEQEARRYKSAGHLAHTYVSSVTAASMTCCGARRRSRPTKSFQRFDCRTGPRASLESLYMLVNL
ncbi:hypothetical protein M440DRAFT_1389315 [Trichoderma longibrachiatum ATCC 18648]|uniref:Uncharacterized protein n=1 Tax=Trichoderma longibrachiatum ATCC 18648 TaxID=983965 RepID=A0A2T4CCL0_TRILO|nr:hypothetical protein M440DRAFT_1389315 [Trichoderma longibrachiatum ATCC 18648]